MVGKEREVNVCVGVGVGVGACVWVRMYVCTWVRACVRGCMELQPVCTYESNFVELGKRGSNHWARGRRACNTDEESTDNDAVWVVFEQFSVMTCNIEIAHNLSAYSE